ncbi:MAG: glycosyltransferase family 4 protein [Hyphomicrobiales bacterium]|nr:glycosyltransferase family 4 protein [Hyphomicrobiales bacterium]
MRFAFFTSIVPDGDPTTGFEIANDAVLAGLRELGHSVTVFGFRLPRQAGAGLGDQVVLGTRELENATAGGAQKLVWLARALQHGLPFAAAKLVDFPKRELARAMSEHGPFDAHILNSYQMAAAFPELLQHPYLYVAHNVEHRSAQQNAEVSPSILQRYLYRRDARLLRSLEEDLCRHARFTWTFSADDTSDHDLSADTGCHLPLFLPTSNAQEISVKKQYDVGLIGTWSWQPNFLGLKWFVEEVVPKLPVDISIAVAGSVPDTPLKSDPRVQYLGRVDSAENFLNSVRIIPLISRGGTGVQLKTIEAFQSGRACVATSSSLRGIDVLPENCLQADTPEEFCNALVTLIEREKAGILPVADGADFLNKQRDGMADGLRLGLAALA